MSLARLKTRFNSILTSINGSSATGFSTSVENAFEALTLVTVMNEYKRVYGNIHTLVHPTNPKFLNQKPGNFWIERSFRIDFVSGHSFYFTADVEVFGLEALNTNSPSGVLFEADVIVIPTDKVNDIINNFNRHPAPQHIDSAFECKYGHFNKSQLRELLGLKRHLSYINGHGRHTAVSTPQLFSMPVRNSTPPIALKMARPRRLTFFDLNTARLYDLEQIVVR